ncbi:MAG: Ig-like domain-containing protein [Candidatus Woesearchaeota archaeon]
MNISTKYAIIALLIAVNLNSIILFTVVFHTTSETTFERLTGNEQARIGMCLDQFINFTQLPNQQAFIDIPYSVDVNVSNEEIYAALNFTDDTDLFNITYSTGEISFTPKLAEYGEYVINITVGNFQCFEYDDSMIFSLTVNNTNHAPILNLSSNFTNLVQGTLFYFNVSNNATDPDGDSLIFYDNTSLFNIDLYTGIIAFTPTNSQVGNHSVRITVSDGQLIDDQDIIFMIRNFNDPPVLMPIGAKTAKVNETFKINISAYDVDVYENLTFFSNYSWFLNMSGPNATVNTFVNMTLEFYFDNFSQWNGTYYINMTVNDSNGTQDSEVFAFTITFINYPPNITSYSPLEKAYSVYTGQFLEFSITKEDPNGNIPSTTWLINDVPVSNLDIFNWSSVNQPLGEYNFTARVTDGEYDDAESWIITILPQLPFVAGTSVGSGGFGGGVLRSFCEELWVCTDWEVCSIAGIQTRECEDLSKCGSVKKMPGKTRSCIYVEMPGCSDGVQNQDEVLIDCGGTCMPCPTCDDKIQNHGEEGVDCGGPCPACQEQVREPAKEPKLSYSPKEMINYVNAYWFIWFILSILVLSTIRLIDYTAKVGIRDLLSSLTIPIKIIAIKILMARTNSLIKANKIDKAKKAYSRVKSLYLSLPKSVMRNIKI